MMEESFVLGGGEPADGAGELVEAVGILLVVWVRRAVGGEVGGVVLTPWVAEGEVAARERRRK